ncbi:hypothetical protein, partial [Peribacillus frigoritolerans]|uniref:hypothetical protein n=1 Tax=Peribacillus frigoritolerans TaxID=450367 RepID=UPI003D2D5684
YVKTAFLEKTSIWKKDQFVRTYINERFVELLKKKWNLVSKSRKDMLYINIMNDKNIYIL